MGSTKSRALSTCIVATVLLSNLAHAATYNLVKEYQGQNFFNDWTYYDHYDNLTNGDVIFVSASTAASSRLTYVDASTQHAFIKVDNTSVVKYNGRRSSVRISTKDRYAVGSVWVADFYHVPYGCSVWPAWWSHAPEWPKGGEIDTFEGVNDVSRNQMGLHTLDVSGPAPPPPPDARFKRKAFKGCKQVSPVQSSSLINSTDCGVDSNLNEGCVTTNPSYQSYGAAFAKAGGGVYVTEFAASGISIWFYSRPDVPSSISPSANSSQIDTSTLGTPVGNWPSGGCDVNTYFEPQNLIFDITLCGDYAGRLGIFNETCSGVCYTNYVVGTGVGYADAYFEIGSVRVYEGNGTVLESKSTGPMTRGGGRLGWSGLVVVGGFVGWLM